MDKLFNTPWKIFLLYAGIGILAYFNAFSGSFMFDDYAYFDSKIKHFDLGYQFDVNTSNGAEMVGARMPMWFRPMASVLLMIEYAFFREHAVLYHVFGLLLWVCAAWMVQQFLCGLFPQKRDLCIFAAALYLIHPINGVVINYITANVYALQVILMLLAFQNNRWLSAFFFILALMCHETALLFPIFAMAVLCIAKNQTIKSAFLQSSPFWVISIAYFIVRLFYASLTHFTLERFSLFQMNMFEYAASVAKLGLWYLWQIISASGIVLLQTFAVVRQFVGLWILVAVAAIAAVNYFWRRNVDPMFRLGLAFFLAGFLILPAAALLQPANGLMIEPHWFAFSSFGFFVLIVAALQKYRFLLVFSLCFWMIAGWRMNYLWANEERYGTYWHDQSPMFMSLVYHMGRIYQRDKDSDKEQYFDEIAFKHRWRLETVAPSLAKIYLRRNQPDHALNLLKTAIDQQPNLVNSSEVLRCLGVAEGMKNNVGLAKKLLTRSMAISNQIGSEHESIQMH